MATSTAPKITTEMELIGPLEAEQLLGLNTHNRKIREPYVKQLAGAMERGEWRFNGDAIRISEFDSLLDGQHRLRAVVMSGKSLEFLVIRGLPMSAQDTMDTGARRTLPDMLKLRGEVNTNILAVAVRAAWYYDHRGTMRKHLPYPTNQELLGYLEDNAQIRELLRPSLALVSRLRTSPAATGALRMLFADADEADAEEFFRVMVAGTGLREGDPIYAMRRWLELERGRTRKAPMEVQAALMIKAFNAWRRGEERVLMVWKGGGASAEKFPVIDDRPPRFAAGMR